MSATWLLIWFRVPQPDVQRTVEPLTVTRAAGNYRELLTRREIASATIAYFLMFMGVSLFVVYLPYWLAEDIGATPSAIATMFVVGGVANVITGPQAGKLSDKIGRKRIVILSSLGLALVMTLTTFIIRSVWMAYVVFFVTMVLIAMRMSPISALLTALVSDDRRGSLMSLAVATGQVGFAVGSAIAGPLYSALGFVSDTVLGALALLAMATVVGYLVPEPELEPHTAVVAAAD